jgi:hypothetical protein
MSETSTHTLRRDAIRTGIFGFLAIAVLCGFGLYQYGSIRAAIAALGGQVLYVQPVHGLVGDFRPDETRDVTVRLQNLSSAPVKVVGANSTCGCLNPVDGLPVVLSSGEIREIAVHVVPPSGAAKPPIVKPVPFENVVTFFVDDPQAPPGVTLRGRILPAPAVQ